MVELLAISSVLLWGAVILSLLFNIALARRINDVFKPKEKTLSIADKAPDFTINTLDGEKITLASISGMETVFVFIAPTCKPCREEMPNLQALASQLKNSAIRLILVSLANETETQAFVKELDIRIPIASAVRETNPFLNDYKVFYTPSYYVINSEGYIAAEGRPTDKAWKNFSKRWVSDVSDNKKPLVDRVVAR